MTRGVTWPQEGSIRAIRVLPMLFLLLLVAQPCASLVDRHIQRRHSSPSRKPRTILAADDIRLKFKTRIQGISDHTTRKSSSTTDSYLGSVNVCAVAVDDGGNTYVLGDFETPLVKVGDIEVRNRNPSSADVFLAKLSPAGQPEWACSWGGDQDDLAIDVVWDADTDALYVTGDFQSPKMTFMDCTPSAPAKVVLKQDSETAGETFDIFVAKLQSQGGLVWATRIGDGLGEESGTGLAVNTHGVYVACRYENVGVNGRTNADTMVATLDTFTGQVIEAAGQFWGGEAEDLPAAIATDGPNSRYLYVAGISSSNLLVVEPNHKGVTADGTTTAIGGSQQQMMMSTSSTSSISSISSSLWGVMTVNNTFGFLVAIDTASRKVAWTQSLGKVASSWTSTGITGIAVDAKTASVYVTGDFTSKQVLSLLIKGGFSAASSTSSTSLSRTGLPALLRLDSRTGELTWAAGLPTTVINLTLDSYGFLYFAGVATPNVDSFLPMSEPGTPFVAKVDPRSSSSNAGNILFAEALQDGSDCDVADMDVDFLGSAYVVCSDINTGAEVYVARVLVVGSRHDRV